MSQVRKKQSCGCFLEPPNLCSYKVRLKTTLLEYSSKSKRQQDISIHREGLVFSKLPSGTGEKGTQVTIEVKQVNKCTPKTPHQDLCHGLPYLLDAQHCLASWGDVQVRCVVANHTEETPKIFNLNPVAFASMSGGNRR
jgi:hypothetical protein